MAVDSTKMRLDNMRVTVNATDIGLTEGGVEISIQTKVIEMTGDQYGITPLATKNGGSRVTVKFAVKEVATYAHLAKILHEGTLRSTGGTGVGVGGTLVGVNDGITNAVPIILHPLDLADATLTNDINIWKAVPLGDVNIKLGPDKETLYEVTFLALRDSTKTAGKQLIDFGLAAAT
jgi:hypothetical protein